MADLIHWIYDAATDSKAWQPFLRELSATLDGALPAVVFSLGDPPRFETLEGHAAIEPAWVAQLCQLEVWRRAVSSLPDGAIAHDETLTPDGALRRWARPLGLHRSLVAMLGRNDEDAGVLVLFRRHRRETFSDGEIDLLHGIVPHLRRALEIHGRLARATAERRAAEAVLECLPFGVVLLDASGRICGANYGGERLLRRDDGLGRDGEGIRAARPADTGTLRGLVAEAARGAGAAERPQWAVARLPRPSGLRDLAVAVTPLAAASPSTVGERGPVAALFASDPEARPDLPTSALQRIYELTPAEARLAAAVAQGASLSSVADRLRLSKHTVRNQLKRVFSKTATTRQGELVRLLLDTLGPVRAREQPIDS